jgi:hypothetical protein
LVFKVIITPKTIFHRKTGFEYKLVDITKAIKYQTDSLFLKSSFLSKATITAQGMFDIGSVDDLENTVYMMKIMENGEAVSPSSEQKILNLKDVTKPLSREFETESFTITVAITIDAQ